MYLPSRISITFCYCYMHSFIFEGALRSRVVFLQLELCTTYLQSTNLLETCCSCLGEQRIICSYYIYKRWPSSSRLSLNLSQEIERGEARAHLQKGAVLFSFSLECIMLLIIRWVKRSLEYDVLCLNHIHELLPTSSLTSLVITSTDQKNNLKHSHQLIS